MDILTLLGFVALWLLIGAAVIFWVDKEMNTGKKPDIDKSVRHMDGGETALLTVGAITWPIWLIMATIHVIIRKGFLFRYLSPVFWAYIIVESIKNWNENRVARKKLRAIDMESLRP